MDMKDQVAKFTESLGGFGLLTRNDLEPLMNRLAELERRLEEMERRSEIAP